MSRTTKKQSETTTDHYLKLVQHFPLRPIRTQTDYRLATQILKDLGGRADGSLTMGESDYADVLTRLVRDYDEQHSSLLKEKALGRKPSPIDLLRYLMEEHGMNTIALGKLVGGSGQASMILSGKRELSKANIRILAERFNISAALLI